MEREREEREEGGSWVEEVHALMFVAFWMVGYGGREERGVCAYVCDGGYAANGKVRSMRVVKGGWY